MIIVGELINSTRRKVGEAVVGHDAAVIQELALKQGEAGADYLDVNAGARPDREADDMAWLVETVQAVTEAPLRRCVRASAPAEGAIWTASGA